MHDTRSIERRNVVALPDLELYRSIAEVNEIMRRHYPGAFVTIERPVVRARWLSPFAVGIRMTRREIRNFGGGVVRRIYVGARPRRLHALAARSARVRRG